MTLKCLFLELTPKGRCLISGVISYLGEGDFFQNVMKPNIESPKFKIFAVRFVLTLKLPPLLKKLKYSEILVGQFYQWET